MKDKTFNCLDCKKEFRVKAYTPETTVRELCPQCYTKRMNSIKFHILPKDKKLLKSSKVRKYLKEVEAVIAYQLIKQDAKFKIELAVALGVPLKIHDDGRIEIVKDCYKNKETP